MEMAMAGGSEPVPISMIGAGEENAAAALDKCFEKWIIHVVLARHSAAFALPFAMLLLQLLMLQVALVPRSLCCRCHCF